MTNVNQALNDLKASRYNFVASMIKNATTAPSREDRYNFVASLIKRAACGGMKTVQGSSNKCSKVQMPSNDKCPGCGEPVDSCKCKKTAGCGKNGKKCNKC